MTSKTQLRKDIAGKRDVLDPQWIMRASEAIIQKVQTLDAFKRAKMVALYNAIKGEVKLDALFELCWKQEKQTCIPVFNTEGNYYELAGICSETRFITGNYGILEPESPSLLAVESVDLIIVPGVAFDPAGNRLGRGGGYYDRLLHGFSGISTAVAFDFQLFPHIPIDSHDIPVDFVITQTKIVKVRNEH